MLTISERLKVMVNRFFEDRYNLKFMDSLYNIIAESIYKTDTRYISSIRVVVYPCDRFSDEITMDENGKYRHSNIHIIPKCLYETLENSGISINSNPNYVEYRVEIPKFIKTGVLKFS
jgi:hypothetical protein